MNKPPQTIRNDQPLIKPILTLFLVSLNISGLLLDRYTGQKHNTSTLYSLAVLNTLILAAYHRRMYRTSKALYPTLNIQQQQPLIHTPQEGHCGPRRRLLLSSKHILYFLAETATLNTLLFLDQRFGIPYVAIFTLYACTPTPKEPQQSTATPKA